MKYFVAFKQPLLFFVCNLKIAVKTKTRFSAYSTTLRVLYVNSKFEL